MSPGKTSLNDQNMLKTVIIDDDYVSRIVLREMLEKFLDNIEILGEAGTVAEGVKLIEDTDPELFAITGDNSRLRAM